MHSDAGIWEKHLCVFLLRVENNNNNWVFAGICTSLRKTSFNTKSWVGLLSARGNVSTRSFSALIAKITSKCIQSKDKQSKWTFSCYRRNIVSLLNTFVFLQYLHHHVKLGSLNVTHWVFMFPLLTGYTPSFGHRERSSSRLIHFVCSLWGVIAVAEATPIRSVCLHVKGHFSGQLCSDWQWRSLSDRLMSRFFSCINQMLGGFCAAAADMILQQCCAWTGCHCLQRDPKKTLFKLYSYVVRMN